MKSKYFKKYIIKVFQIDQYNKHLYIKKLWNCKINFELWRILKIIILDIVYKKFNSYIYTYSEEKKYYS